MKDSTWFLIRNNAKENREKWLLSITSTNKRP
jgi:hypothetical protein